MVTKEDFMLCDSVTEDIAKTMPDSLYVANRKYDGERIIAVVQNGQVALMNRRGFIKNLQYEEVVEDLKAMPNCILDGECISFDDNFNRLQRRSGTKNTAKQKILMKEIPVKYMVFDILQLDGKVLTGLMLRDRVTKLQGVFNNFNTYFSDRKPFVEMAEYEPINQMLGKAHTEDREGIIVKTWNGIYEGKRSKAWLKCKFFLEKTIKICSYTVNPAGIRTEDKDGNAVQISGGQHVHVKQLLDSQGEVEIYVQYLEMTADNRMRFPSFRGLVGE
jgi:ATP-dependent DNA ligase